MKPITSFILSWLIMLPSHRLLGGEISLLGGKDAGTRPTGAEYFSELYPGAILVPIYLWGAVPRSGLHHIPKNTDLPTLLTLAGGPDSDAELDKITIKRRSGKESRTFKYDMQAVMQSQSQDLAMLEPYDIVYVPKEKPVISSNTVLVVSIVASLLGIGVSSFVLLHQIKD